MKRLLAAILSISTVLGMMVISVSAASLPGLEDILTLSNEISGTHTELLSEFTEDMELIKVEKTIYEVAVGTTIKLTDKAIKEGYYISCVTTLEDMGTEFTVQEASTWHNTYFIGSSGKAGTYTIFIQGVNLNNGFSDVPSTAYYYEPVEWAVRNGVTSGTTATTFSPDATCTRAQILTFMWRAQGSPEWFLDLEQNPFTDVSENDYYYKAALWAYSWGIYTEEAFNGNTPCTRGETMLFLWRMCGKEDAGYSTFSDVDRNSEYSPAIAWAVKQGITSGTSATTFSPNNTCTRGQIMTFLYKKFAD